MGDAEQQATRRRWGLGVLQVRHIRGSKRVVETWCCKEFLKRTVGECGWSVKVAGHGEAVRPTTRSERFLEELPITCSSVQPQKERLRCWSMPLIAPRTLLPACGTRFPSSMAWLTTASGELSRTTPMAFAEPSSRTSMIFDLQTWAMGLCL